MFFSLSLGKGEKKRERGSEKCLVYFWDSFSLVLLVQGQEVEAFVRVGERARSVCGLREGG